MLQFEAGQGKKFESVNYITNNAGIYAEVEVPEGASEDYGYLTMKKAIIDRFPAAANLAWWYDNQEDKLEPDASADAEVYLDIE